MLGDLIAHARKSDGLNHADDFGGIFLFSFTLLSKSDTHLNAAKASASTEVASVSASATAVARNIRCARNILDACARSSPSTSTLTVPSGQFEQLQTLASVPTS